MTHPHCYVRAAFAIAAALLAAQLSAAPPPASAFAELPPILDADLSPDGSRAVILRAIGETHHAVLADFDAGRMSPLMAADPEQFLFNWCRWANDERIVCSIRSYGTVRAGQLPGTFRRYRDGRAVFTRLLAVNADGSQQLQLVPEAVTRPGEDLEWNPNVQDDVISWLEDDPDHLLIQLRREGSTPSVYRLNIYDNGMARVRRPHPSVQAWLADRHGELRLAFGYRGETPVAFGVNADARLVDLDLSGLAGIHPPGLAGFPRERGSAWVFASAGSDKRGLHRVDTRSGAVLETLLTDPDYDVDGRLVVDPRSGEPVVLGYRRERPTLHWFDDRFESRLDGLRRALPGPPSLLRVVSIDRRGDRMIIATEGNGTLPRHYLFDRQSPKQLLLLGQAYPELGSAVEPQPVSFTASDGLRIPGYLTLPPKRADDERLPTVVLPHGGPWWRDDGRFDFWVQFLVSRGYAVLQPNFRGSTGYGDGFLAAGFEQWGLAMQSDLEDGLDWLIETGVTDPDRVCFVGGSYGGYAALVAAFKTPKRLRCAVSFAGVTDLDDLVVRWRQFILGELSVARVQSGETRRASSPLHQAHRIGVPLLIVHGDVDRSVVIDHSRSLVEALEAAGKPYRYVEQANGDHHLSLYSHRLEFLEELEAFLAQHLGRSWP